MKRACIACVVACALLLNATTGRAQTGVTWRPDERVLISDFSRVLALTHDGATLYAVTPNGMLLYDIASRRFRLPLTAEDGYPVAERPTAVAYAHSDFRVLLGTSAGNVYALSSARTRFDNVARLQSAVSRIIASRGELDAFAQTRTGWFRLRTGSLFPEPVSGPPAAIVQPGANDPYLRTMIGSAGTVAGRGSAAVAALEADRTPGRYFAGTLGNGIVQLDTRTTERQRLPYGLNTRGAAAIATWHGRVWFGGDERSALGPLVSATSDLGEFRDYLPTNGAPQDPVTALLAYDSTLWVGTHTGLYALRGAPGRERWQGRPFAGADRVNALAAGSDGRVYVGSDRGASRLSRGGDAPEPILSGPIVYGFAPGVDTVWIATNVGVAAYAVAGGAAVVLRGGGSPEEPVFDVRIVADTLYAVTRDGLYRRGRTGWSLPDRSVAQRLGPLGRLRTDGSAIWVLGTFGFAMKRAQSPVWTYYVASNDIPEAPVRDLLPLDEFLWVATPAGALRIQRQALN